MRVGRWVKNRLISRALSGSAHNEVFQTVHSCLYPGRNELFLTDLVFADPWS